MLVGALPLPRGGGVQSGMLALPGGRVLSGGLPGTARGVQGRKVRGGEGQGEALSGEREGGAQ